MKYKFIFISFLLIFMLIGCNQNEEVPKVDDFLFTYTEVFNTLTDNGLELIEDKNIETEVYKLYYTIPKIFDMENNEALLVYTFNDMNGRRVAEEELFIQKKQFVELFDDNIISLGTCVAKNALLVYTVSEVNKYGSDIYEKLHSIVFKQLNEGVEVLYTGNGENWEGEILVKYYGHWWEDENGNFIDYDNKRQETGKLHYMGNVDDVVTSIDYKFEKGDLGSFGGEEHVLSKNGIINTGTSSGNGRSPINDTIYTVTINWNNKVEILELKAEESK